MSPSRSGDARPITASIGSGSRGCYPAMYQRCDKTLPLMTRSMDSKGAQMQSHRPRLKVSAPVLHAGGELHVIGREDVTSLADPDGAVHRLMQLADGSRNTSELFSALVTDYPRIAEQDVHDAIRELASAGLFELGAPRLRVFDR
jgi:hypothetical protein